MTLSPVLNVYKNMLKLAKTLPKDKRQQTIDQIRTQFRSNSSENDQEKVKKLLEQAQSSLGYLKMVTPRQFGSQAGVTRIVFGENNGKVTKAVSNWTGKNLDPDSIRRHYNSLKRAGFKDNGHAKGGFF